MLEENERMEAIKKHIKQMWNKTGRAFLMESNTKTINPSRDKIEYMKGLCLGYQFGNGDGLINIQPTVEGFLSSLQDDITMYTNMVHEQSFDQSRCSGMRDSYIALRDWIIEQYQIPQQAIPQQLVLGDLSC